MNVIKTWRSIASWNIIKGALSAAYVCWFGHFPVFKLSLSVLKVLSRCFDFLMTLSTIPVYRLPASTERCALRPWRDIHTFSFPRFHSLPSLRQIRGGGGIGLFSLISYNHLVMGWWMMFKSDYKDSAQMGARRQVSRKARRPRCIFNSLATHTVLLRQFHYASVAAIFVKWAAHSLHYNLQHCSEWCIIVTSSLLIHI